MTRGLITASSVADERDRGEKGKMAMNAPQTLIAITMAPAVHSLQDVTPPGDGKCWPPKKFTGQIAQSMSGTVLLNAGRVFNNEPITMAMDHGAQCPCILKSAVPEHMFRLAVPVRGTMGGIAPGATIEVTQMVPVLVAMGSKVQDALWVYMFPMDELPFGKNVSVLLDHITILAMVESVNYYDPRQVKITIRTTANMRDVANDFCHGDMDGVHTQVCNRTMCHTFMRDYYDEKEEAQMLAAALWEVDEPADELSAISQMPPEWQDDLYPTWAVAPCAGEACHPSEWELFEEDTRMSG